MKTLILGSTVVDVILRLPRLPRSQESCNIYHQELRLGGCAFNASEALRRFGADYTLFSPVGGGVYGDYVRRELGKLGVASPIPAPESENGCCYCFVEEGGERTFISYHGAEYRFEKPWFDALNAADYGVQAGAVSASGQDSDLSHVVSPSQFIKARKGLYNNAARL